MDQISSCLWAIKFAIKSLEPVDKDLSLLKLLTLPSLFHSLQQL